MSVGAGLTKPLLTRSEWSEMLNTCHKKIEHSLPIVSWHSCKNARYKSANALCPSLIDLQWKYSA